MKKSSHEKNLYLFIIGIVALGLLLYGGMRTLTFAQSAVPAPDSHTSCLPTKDYPNSNGYTESYTRPNNCHSKKVFFSNGTYYRSYNNGRVRCPAGATTYLHSRAHYMMSPTMDGDYDGGAGGSAHYYCVDAGGNQVDAIPGESEANPYHTHMFDGLAKADIVDSDADYYYSYKTGQWVSCPGGYQGPFPNNSGNTDTSQGNFNNHFHCKNASYPVGSTTDNPEAVPVTLSPAPQASLVGSFSNSDSGIKDQFVDKGPWGTPAPLGTVSCIHTNSNKVYFSTTGACPAASQFPLKPTYSFELTKVSSIGTVEAKTGATASLKFKLKNTSTADTEFPVYCDSGYGSFTGSMYYLNADGTVGAKFVNPNAYAGETSVPSANVVIAPGAEKSFVFTFNIPASVSISVGGWTAKCHTYPMEISTRNTFTDKKQEVTDAFSVTAPVVTPPSTGTADSTVTLNPQTSIGPTKYTVTVSDPDGIKTFLVNKTNSRGSVFGGGPSCSKTVSSSTVTLESADFPLSASVTDCRVGAAAYTFSVNAPGSVTPPTTPGSAPVISSLSPATGKVGSSVTITGSGFTSIGNKIKFGGQRTEEDPTYNLPSADGKTLTFNVPQWAYFSCSNTLIPCASIMPMPTQPGSYEVQVMNQNGTSASMMFTVVSDTDTGGGSAKSCSNGEKCTKGSWCTNGQKCFYPDNQLTCVAWPSGSGGSAACPTGTSVCDPSDANCVAPGQTVPYTPGKWCSQSQQYYSPEGKSMTCVTNGFAPPTGYSSCRPDDKNCIPENGYGPSTGWCSNGMKCYQKDSDTNSQNDIFCAKMSSGSAAAPATSAPATSETPNCAAGYSSCSPTDKNCKQKGDAWTDTNSSYYCTSSQKCSLSSGGGTCVGWNETCPAGTKYCTGNDASCIEPDTYIATSPSVKDYYCMSMNEFYSATQAYCPPKKSGTNMQWTAAEVREILTKLGSEWSFCRPGDTNCIEPGKTGPSSGYCAWWPPNYSGSPMMTSGLRTCPSLDGSTETCIGDGSTTGSCPPKRPPDEVRVCGANEMYDPYADTTCRIPMHRWNINDMKWEKCDVKNPPLWTNVKDNPKATHTNCESFDFGIEREWREERFRAHDPRIDGEWYMPPWDAAVQMYRYNPKTDGFETCENRPFMELQNSASSIMMPYEWTPPCTPVTEKDKSWLLKKARAEYKMSQLWAVKPPVPVKPGDPVIPKPVMPVVPRPPVVPLPEIPAAQCKGYLASIRQSLASDKQFWKDLNNQLTQAKNYSDADAIRQLLDEAKQIIFDLEKLVKIGRCASDLVSDIQTKTDKLRTEIFPELSSYLPSLRDYVAYRQCRAVLDDKVTQLKELKTKNLDEESEEIIDGLLEDVDGKVSEFESRLNDFDYDATFECSDFTRELESDMAPLFRLTDNELNRVIDEVVSAKLESAIGELTEQLEKRGKRIDALLVQLGQLHQAVQSITQAAVQISEKISVSYTALARIEEKFAEEKAEMQAAKERLMPLVEQATQVMNEKRCLTRADQERLVREFGNVVSVNWVGDGDEEMEKRLNLFIASCQARSVNAADVVSFERSVDESSAHNLELSYRQGITAFPDVPTDEWYYGAMMTAWRGGQMTQGRPAENVLRQDALLMMLRANGATDAEITGSCRLNATGVTSVSPYAICAVNRAASEGLVLSGPMNVPVSRVEMVQWLVALKGMEPADSGVLDSYTDLYGLTGPQRSAVASIVASGVMVGNVSAGSSTFSPHMPITRAALAVILEKLDGANADLQH